MKQPLVFLADGPLTPVEFLAEDFPLLQTQALLITLDELEAWVTEAQIRFRPVRVLKERQCSPPKPCLESCREWLDMAQNYVLDMREALEEDEDSDDLLKCRLTADDPLIEALETVLDNCMGSGTTAIACINTNRNFIGFELDETYFNLANERIANHK